MTMNVSYILEGGTVYINVSQVIWFIRFFKSRIFFLIFFLVLSVAQRGMLKTPTKTVDLFLLSIFFFPFMYFECVLCFLEYQIKKCLCLSTAIFRQFPFKVIVDLFGILVICSCVTNYFIPQQLNTRHIYISPFLSVRNLGKSQLGTSASQSLRSLHSGISQGHVI